jgi:hypothetical protein
MSLLNRYDDGYLLARSDDGAGRLIQIAGLIVGGAFAIGSFVLASKIPMELVVGATVLGVLIGLIFYALGVLVSVQGQILLATLDSAVNSSPLLSRDEVRLVLLRLAEIDPTSLSINPKDPSNPDGRCPQCSSPFWYADYRREAERLLCGACQAELPRPSRSAVQV